MKKYLWEGLYAILPSFCRNMSMNYFYLLLQGERKMKVHIKQVKLRSTPPHPNIFCRLRFWYQTENSLQVSFVIHSTVSVGQHYININFSYQQAYLTFCSWHGLSSQKYRKPNAHTKHLFRLTRFESVQSWWSVLIILTPRIYRSSHLSSQKENTQCLRRQQNRKKNESLKKSNYIL